MFATCSGVGSVCSSPRCRLLRRVGPRRRRNYFVFDDGGPECTPTWLALENVWWVRWFRLCSLAFQKYSMDRQSGAVDANSVSAA